MESSRESGCRQELGRLVQFCACRKPTSAICRVMLFSLSREVELAGDLVSARQRAQFLPRRILDLDTVLAALLLAQIFDLARIEHAAGAFRRRRRFQIARELRDLASE